MLFRRVIAIGFRSLLVAAAVSTGGEERVNPSTETVRQDGAIQPVARPAPAGQWLGFEDTPPPEDPPPEETPTPEPSPTPTEVP